MESVVVLTVSHVNRAQDAMRELHRLQDKGSLRLVAAAIVEGVAHGRVRVVGDEQDQSLDGTAAATTIGALLAAFGGPVGLDLGEAAGAIVGSLLDIAEVEESGTVAANDSRSFPPRKGVVLAVVAEPRPAALEAVAPSLGATLLRQPRAEVERELAAAEEAVLATQGRGGTRPEHR